MRAVYDLHCDLLYYLAAEPHRTPLQSTSRCALHQLRDGGVRVQVLAVFTTGNDESVVMGGAQVDWYDRILVDYASHYLAVRSVYDLGVLDSEAPGDGPIGVMPAIENASSFCGAQESLDTALARLRTWQERVGPILYAGLTWKPENRFGGGDMTPSVGLKDDGRQLLEVLAELDIAVDLSHASDALAEQILEFVEREDLPVVPLASHSNFRAVTAHTRNLPDELAAAVVERGGVIGLNLVKGYVGPDIGRLATHLTHASERGWGRAIALGTDFFYEGDLPSAKQGKKLRFFFEGYETAAHHGALQARLADELGDDCEPLLSALTTRNARRFLESRLSPRPTLPHGRTSSS